MRKSFLILCIICIFLMSSLNVIGDDITPKITIPSPDILITMKAEDGENSSFDITLSSIPSGYDITDGTYHGWCIQKEMMMTKKVNHSVRLYLSTDSNLPEDIKNENWPKINYIINNKQGDSRVLQEVIWYYCSNYQYPTNLTAQAIIADADENGLNFIPKEKEKIAIVVDGIEKIQNTFIEYEIPKKSSIDDNQLPLPQPIKIENHAPTADGTAGEPYIGFSYEEIIFDGSRSYDRDGTVKSWKWKFSDNSILTGDIVKYAFNEPGEYKATLIVVDNNGLSDSYTALVIVKDRDILPNKPIITGPKHGVTYTLYDFIIKSNEPAEDSLQYIIEWGDGEIIIIDYSLDNPSINYPYMWSEPGHYTINVKALINYTESEEALHTILIDVLDVHNLGYLIDENSDGKYNLFHNNKTGIENKIKILKSGKYLIDSNGDDKWDQIYDPITDELSRYKEKTEINYLMIVLMLIICPILIIFIFGKKKGNHKF